MSEDESQDNGNGNLLEKIRKTYIADAAWEFLTWEARDLRDYQEDIESEDVFPAKVGMPNVFLGADDREKMLELLGMTEHMKYRVVFRPETIEQVMQITPDLTVDAQKIRGMINAKFGEGKDDLFEQEGLVGSAYVKADAFNSFELGDMCRQLEESLGAEYDQVPAEIRMLAAAVQAENMCRKGVQRISIDPYIVAMSYRECDLACKQGQSEENKFEEENRHIEIIACALYNSYDRNKDEAEKSLEDAWAKREQTQFTEEEFNVLVPELSVRDVLAAAKELGEEHKDQAIAALKHYRIMRDAYKSVLLKVEEPAETPAE